MQTEREMPLQTPTDVSDPNRDASDPNPPSPQTPQTPNYPGSKAPNLQTSQTPTQTPQTPTHQDPRCLRPQPTTAPKLQASRGPAARVKPLSQREASAQLICTRRRQNTIHTPLAPPRQAVRDHVPAGRRSELRKQRAAIYDYNAPSTSVQPRTAPLPSGATSFS